MGFTNISRGQVLTSGIFSGDPYLQLGDPFAPTPSRWGIDPTGAAYFDAAGAASGESATASLDATTGAPYLTR